MASIAMQVAGIAATILPASSRDRFAAEWVAEIEHIRATAGERLALKYAAKVLAGAPATSMAVRQNSHNAYLELSVASLAGTIPAFIFGLWAALLGLWLMTAIQLVLIVAYLMIATGLWRSEARLFDSRVARIGLGLLIVSGLSGVAFIRLTDQGPRYAEYINMAVPNLALQLGLILLLLSRWLPRRTQIITAALHILVFGGLAGIIASALNAWFQEGVVRLAMLIPVAPRLAIVWGAWRVVQRRRVVDPSDDNQDVHTDLQDVWSTS